MLDSMLSFTLQDQEPFLLPQFKVHKYEAGRRIDGDETIKPHAKNALKMITELPHHILPSVAIALYRGVCIDIYRCVKMRRKYEYLAIYPSAKKIVGSILSKGELQKYLKYSYLFEDREIEEDELAYAIEHAVSVRLIKQPYPNSNLLIIKYTPPL